MFLYYVRYRAPKGLWMTIKTPATREQCIEIAKALRIAYGKQLEIEFFEVKRRKGKGN